MTGRSYVQARHTVEIWVGPSVNNQRRVGTLQFGGFENGIFESTLDESDFPVNDGQVVVSYVLLREISGNYELVSLSAIEINYPKTLDMQNQPLREFGFHDNIVSATIDNVPPDADALLIIDSMQVKNISTTQPSPTQLTFSVASENTKPVKVHIQKYSFPGTRYPTSYFIIYRYGKKLSYPDTQQFTGFRRCAEIC